MIDVFGILLLVIVLAAIFTDRRDLPLDGEWLPSAYQLRAWEKARLVRAEGNRRII